MAYVIGNDCIACGTCIDECPSGAISEGEKYSINPDVCTECGTCADVCPSEAISLGYLSGGIEHTDNSRHHAIWCGTKKERAVSASRFMRAIQLFFCLYIMPLG